MVNGVEFHTLEFDRHFDELHRDFEFLIAENQALREQLRTWNRETEVQSLKSALKKAHSNSLVMLTDKERTETEAFRQKHYESCRNRGTYYYKLTEAGFNTAVEITCPVCGRTKIITDTGSR